MILPPHAAQNQEQMKAYDSILMVAAAVAMSLAPGLASSAAGDSIYLKNGRVIRSDDITVDGDRLVFYQHGGHQAIPMSLVDRIEADDWPAPGSEPRRPLPQENAAPLLDAPSDGRAPPGGSAAALQALSGMLGSGEGGIDMAQALQLLQGLGTQSSGAKAAGGLEALMPLLGMLGGNSNAPGLAGLGGLGDIASDLGKIQTVLPALGRLGGALFAPEYSVAATDSAVRDLITTLQHLGVSIGEIRAQARQLGVPAEILDRIRND